MKRLALVLTAGAAWLFLFAIPAFADNGPHVMGANNASLSGSCAGCHRAHSGQAPNLLKEPVETLCYACHSGVGSTVDVKDGRTSTSAPLRGGGYEYALIDTTNSKNATWAAGDQDSNRSISYIAAQATNSHHSIDGTAVNMWGSGALGTSTTPGTGTYAVTTNLECTSCHDPHGNGQYRILQPLPGDAVTGTAPVYLNDVPLGGTFKYSTLNYGVGTDANHGSAFSESDRNNVANSTLTGSRPDGSAIQYVPQSLAGSGATTGYWKGAYVETSTRWCSTCHTRYMGFRGSAGNITGITDSGTVDATFKFLHATRNIVDPKNPLASTTTVLTPINTGEAIYPAARIGCYTSGTGADTYTYRGVAAVLKADVTQPPSPTCSLNVSGMLGRTSTPPRPDDTRLSSGGPRCITCHVSHGSNATDGLGQTYSLGTRSAETSLVTGAALHSPLLRLDGRGVCQNCHSK